MYHERQDLEDGIAKWEREARFARMEGNNCKTAFHWYLAIASIALIFAPEKAKLVALLPAVASYSEYHEMRKYRAKEKRFQGRADYRKRLIDGTRDSS